ncbi:hypothetical protein GQ53DRAFT_769191 [Thozetella sp. PMI_491]|nr:hypothetical protein GQ53DRAFT_769191 [Thozetella sp. PMI_491]
MFVHVTTTFITTSSLTIQRIQAARPAQLRHRDQGARTRRRSQDQAMYGLVSCSGTDLAETRRLYRTQGKHSVIKEIPLCVLWNYKDQDAVSRFVFNTYLNPATRDEIAGRNAEQLAKLLLSPRPTETRIFDHDTPSLRPPSREVRGQVLQFGFHQGDFALFHDFLSNDCAAKKSLFNPEIFGWMRKNFLDSSLSIHQICDRRGRGSL